MFGQHDDKQGQQNAQIPDQSIDGVISSMPGDQNAPTDPSQNWQHPGTPISTPAPTPAFAPFQSQNTPSDTSAPADPAPTPSAPAPITPDQPYNPSPAPASDNSDGNNDLIDIKQKALGQLSPLVDHLDQSAEDKFRTLMMMIQASDDQSKIKDAYAAAQAIDDEKIRAQALLDVINEINYFTSHNQPEA